MAKDIGISRVSVDRQGYDRRGRYWGVGAPLFYFELYDDVTRDEETGHLRAHSKADARAQLKSKYPHFFTKGNPAIGKLIPCHAIRMRKDGGIDVIGAHTNPRRRRR